MIRLKSFGRLGGIALGLWLAAWLIAGGRPEAELAAAPKLQQTQGGNGVDLVGHLGGAFTRVQSVGNLAYLASGFELAVIDVSDPAHIRRVGYVTLPVPVVDLAVDGSQVYVAADKLYWVDATIPASPTIVASYALSGLPQAVAQAGGAIYVLTSDQGAGQLLLLNTAGGVLTPVGTAALTGVARDVVAVGGYAYIANHEAGLQIVDVSTPGAPTLVSTFGLSGAPTAVAISGDLAVVAQETCFSDCGGYVTVVDVTVKNAPTALGRVATAGQAWDVAVAGETAYVMDSAENLTIISLADPAIPTTQALYHTPGAGRQIAPAGNRAYIADGPAGLLILDIATPSQPFPLGQFATLNTVLDVVVQDNFAYLAEKDAGLTVVDVSSAAQPVIVGRLDTPGFARAVALAGHYAYVADSLGGLRIVDITLPVAPIEVSAYAPGAYAYDVAVQGDYAYVADLYGSLHILNIANPGLPLAVGSLAADGGAWSITLAGDMAYLTDGAAQVRLLSLADPAHPVQIGAYGVDWLARDVAVNGSLLYVADEVSGLHVVDISDPASPRRIAFAGAGANQRLYQVKSLGDFVYVANWTAGLRIYDATQVTRPVEWARLDNTNFAVALALANRYIYVADSLGGLAIAQERFQISGAVRQTNGLPYAGVTMRLDGGEAIPTNPSGNYTYNAVRVGPHVLEPTLTGYQFVPSSRSLTLPTRLASQDFTLLPETISAELFPGVAATLTFNDTQGLPTTLHLPAGAVDEALTLVVQPVIPSSVAGYAPAAHAVVLSVLRAGLPLPDYTFLQPITLSLTYSAADLGGRAAQELLILWQRQSQWVEAPASCTPPTAYTRDLSANRLALDICAVGPYQLMTFAPVIFLPVALRP